MSDHTINANSPKMKELILGLLDKMSQDRQTVWEGIKELRRNNPGEPALETLLEGYDDLSETEDFVRKLGKKDGYKELEQALRDGGFLTAQLPANSSINREDE